VPPSGTDFAGYQRPFCAGIHNERGNGHPPGVLIKNRGADGRSFAGNRCYTDGATFLRAIRNNTPAITARARARASDAECNSAYVLFRDYLLAARLDRGAALMS